MLTLKPRRLRFAVFQAAGILQMRAGRSQARGWRFNYGFSGNGILHDIPIWRVQAANAKGAGRKTLPLINTDETDPKKAGRRSSRRRGRLRSITWGAFDRLRADL